MGEREGGGGLPPCMGCGGDAAIHSQWGARHQGFAKLTLCEKCLAQARKLAWHYFREKRAREERAVGAGPVSRGRLR